MKASLHTNLHLIYFIFLEVYCDIIKKILYFIFNIIYFSFANIVFEKIYILFYCNGVEIIVMRIV